MPWVKLDDGFWSDPAVFECGNEAAGVFTRMLSYSGQHLTDGHIPHDVARVIACRKTPITKLVEVGLLAPNDNGYVIPRYLEFNPSREQVENERRSSAERMRELRANRRRSS